MSIVERFSTSWDERVALYDARKEAGNITWEVDFELLRNANIFYIVMLVILYFGFKGKPFDTTITKVKGEKDLVVKGPTLSAFMQFYNLTCVCAAASSAFCIIAYLVKFGLDFSGNKQGTMDTADGKAWLQYGVYLFYYQKFWEFIDTFIFMIRDSQRQVTILHVYHHTSITVIVALYSTYDSSGDVYLPVMLNSLVHVIMYGYYFCGAQGYTFQRVLRPYITKMQLTQFLIIATQSFMVWFQGPDVGFPDWLKVIMIIYMSTMLTLFGNFFYQQYMKPKATKKE